MSICIRGVYSSPYDVQHSGQCREKSNNYVNENLQTPSSYSHMMIYLGKATGYGLLIQLFGFDFNFSFSCLLGFRKLKG